VEGNHADQQNDTKEKEAAKRSKAIRIVMYQSLANTLCMVFTLAFQMTEAIPNIATLFDLYFNLWCKAFSALSFLSRAKL